MDFVKSIALFVALAFGGCATDECPNVEGPFYKNEIPMTIDGNKMTGGIYIVDKHPTHSIKAHLPPDTEKFLVSACDKFLTWTQPQEEVYFDYATGSPLSEDELCPIESAAFSRNGGHAWSYVDFRTTENLPAELTCHSSTENVLGVSACRAEELTELTIKFKSPVDWVFSEGCPAPETSDSMNFKLVPQDRKCFYLFENEEGFHRTTVIGFKNKKEQL